MSFRKAFHFFTYSTVLWSFGAMAYFTMLQPVAILLFGLALLAAIFRDKHAVRFSNGTWLAFSLSALALAIFGWFYMGERLYSVVYLFLYLEVNKLWTGTRTRDTLHVYGLTLFQMVASSVSTASILFAPALVVYLFLILGALITITMKRDAEIALGSLPRRERKGTADSIRVRAHEQWRLDRIYNSSFLTPGFCRWLVVTLTIILVIGSGLFFVIPRLQAQSFLQGFGTRPGAKAVSGFSDRVEFLGVGRIQTDPTVVMRAKPVYGYGIVQGYPGIDMLRLRGTSLDQFDGRRWRKSAVIENSYQVRQRRRNVYIPRLEGDRIGAGDYVTEITLEPNRNGYLFGPDRATSFHLDSTLDMNMDVESNSVQLALKNWSVPIRYEVHSVELPDTGWELPVKKSTLADLNLRRAARLFGKRMVSLLLPPRRTMFQKLYLQLPDVEDMDLVAEMADEWTEGLATRTDIAKTIEFELKRNYEYSLDVPFASRRNHLSRFLTVEKAGHCEYFATAMALMLRTKGIPARIVNGYASDEWVRSGGGYFLVRQEHAHSWVEVYMDGIGWVTYDPTPNNGIGGNRIPMTFFRRVSQRLDTLKLYWYNTVVDFDARNQYGFYRSIIRAAYAIPRTVGFFTGVVTGEDGMSGRKRFVILGLLLAGVVVAVLILRELNNVRKVRRKRKKAHVSGYASKREPIREYLRLLEEVEKRVERPVSQTPLEYARRVVHTGDGLEDFLSLTQTYYDARFNGGVWTHSEANRATALLRRVRTGGQIAVPFNDGPEGETAESLRNDY